MQKIEKVVEVKTQELKTTAYRAYHGVVLSREFLKSYLSTSFSTYGMEDQIDIAIKTLTCESNFDWWADNGISIGVAQFTEPTWNQFCEGEYRDMNPLSQINCMTLMWKRGLQSRWDCWRNLTVGQG